MPKKVSVDMATILQLVKEGYTAPRIANKLDVSARYIKRKLENDYPEMRELLRKNSRVSSYELRFRNF